MKFNVSLFTCTALLAGASIAHAATVVNVNFGATRTEANLTGPIGSAGETWNQAGTAKSATDLTDSAGGETTIDWSLSGSLSNNTETSWNDGTPVLMLQSGFFVQDNNVRTLTISGLTAGTYDLYIASFDQNKWTNTPMSFSTINTTDTVGAQVANPTQGTSWALNTNYVLFEGLVPNASNEIAIDGARVPGGLYGFWNGFQLVEVAGVPEPSAAALIGLGTFMLLLRRRRS